METQQNFTEAIARIYECTGVKTQTALGKVLGLKQSSVCYGFQAETIPYRWLYILLRDRNINPVWILHGEPHKRYVIPSETTELEVETTC